MLKHIKDAMAPDSVVLIGDIVLSTRAGPEDIAGATFGVIIFNMAGKERTIEGFNYLFKQAGLEYVRIWSAGQGHLVEARLPQ